MDILTIYLLCYSILVTFVLVAFIKHHKIKMKIVKAQSNKCIHLLKGIDGINSLKRTRMISELRDISRINGEGSLTSIQEEIKEYK
jgi:hypothetical protein